MKTVLILILFTASVFAQYPGYFYTFEMKDENGKTINSNNDDYKVWTISCSGCKDQIILGISICDDNKTWRFYAGGNYEYLGTANMLKIERMANGTAIKTMIIEFPSTNSCPEKSYLNLFAGTFEFMNGTYTVKLPKTNEEWKNLKEIKVCPDIINPNYSFYDISKFQ